MEAIILCGRCLAFVMKNDRYGQGECHRHAPVPAERDDVLWPKRLASEPGCFEAILSASRHDVKIEAAPVPEPPKPEPTKAEKPEDKW